MAPDHDGRGNRDPWAFFFVGVGLALRLASVRAVFRGGNIYFVDPDDYYHLRRMMTAAANFPRLLSFDRYLGFPSGFHCNWPPLYDWLTGLLMMGAGLKSSQLIAAFIPPIAGAATLWLFWRVAARLLDRRAALCALAVAAVLPMPAFYTMAGRPDHHCVENLWFLLGLLPVLDVLEGRNAKRFAASAALAAGTLCWIGSVMFAAVLFLTAMAELSSRRESPRVAGWLGWMLLLEALFLAPLCLSGYWAGLGSVDFDAPSFFQPLFLLALGHAILAVHSHRTKGGRTSTWLHFGFAAAWSSFLAYRSAASVALFAGAPLPVFQMATEMQPFLKPFGRWSTEYAGEFLGYALWVLPPLAWLFYKRARTSQRRLVLFWAGITGALALWQTRYAYHFSYPAALLLGFGGDASIKFLQRRVSRTWAWSLAMAGMILVLAPALHNSAGLVMADARDLTVDADLIETCDWLRNNTPPTRSLYQGEGPPEYGVYALHDFGGPITAIAQRPAAAGNMHVMRDQIIESTVFFFMDSEDQAFEFLRSRRFRYVVLSDMVHNGDLAMEAKGIGIQGITQHLWDLVYMRLYVNDGSFSNTGARAVAPVGHLRLVHESPTETFGVKRFKVFEVVPGAVVSGRCGAGVVEASAPVRTDQGRGFVYRTFAPCEGGRYVLDLPYVGKYDLAAGKARRGVGIDESAVESGASLSRSF